MDGGRLQINLAANNGSYRQNPRNKFKELYGDFRNRYFEKQFIFEYNTRVDLKSNLRPNLRPDS